MISVFVAHCVAFVVVRRVDFVEHVARSIGGGEVSVESGIDSATVRGRADHRLARGVDIRATGLCGCGKTDTVNARLVLELGSIIHPMRLSVIGLEET